MILDFNTMPDLTWSNFRGGENNTIARMYKDTRNQIMFLDELGYEVEAVKVEDVFEKMLEEYDEEETGNEEIRPPVVTVMGHYTRIRSRLSNRAHPQHL